MDEVEIEVRKNIDMKTEKLLFNWAIKNGKYISINVFDPGEGMDCGCECPKCDKKVVSNVTAKKPEQLKRKFTNHFSHYDENSTCKGGHGETEIHLFAKQVIEENNSLEVPGIGEASNQLSYFYAVSEPAFPFEKYKQKRPDILLYDDSGVLAAIEIVVTNPVSEEKTSHYEEAQLKCLSIDLSFYYKKDHKTFRDRIKKDILGGTSKKEWVWTDEKPVVLKELSESNSDKEKSKNEPNNSNSGVNPVVPTLIAGLIFYFRKPIMRFLKKVLWG